jgi:hypothetical protein
MSRKWRIMTGTEGTKEILIFNILDLHFLARNAMFFFLQYGGSSCHQNDIYRSTSRQISEGRNL